MSMEVFKGKFIPAVGSYYSYDGDRASKHISKRAIRYIVQHRDCNGWTIRCSAEAEIREGFTKGCSDCLFYSKELIIEWAVSKGHIAKADALTMLLESKQ